MRRILCIAGCLLLLGCLTVTAAAEKQEARNIADAAVISCAGVEDLSFLTDGISTEALLITGPIQLSSDEPIAGVSLVMDQPCDYYIRDLDSGKEVLMESGGFLHCFCDLEAAFGYGPTQLELGFPADVMLGEIGLYSSGTLPASVQRWEPPLTAGADMVLFSTHGDDEQLYFAGLLPYYAGQRQLDVQVVYMTDHADTGSVRMHEMLNGLWAVGVRAYPVFGYFPDFKLPYREDTYWEYARRGYSREELLGYVVENLRRFRPQVAVGHDLNGEYGHGMHKVYADLLTKAVDISADPAAYPESAARYGVWDVPKTYLHLYKENQIIMNWDEPLSAFGGMTAFEVCQKLGFPCHGSQQYDQYVYWLYGPGNSITMASQIQHYSPCLYGLYRSTVGEDVLKTDLMENLTSYAQQSRLHAEQMAQLQKVVEDARREQAAEPKLLRQPDPVESETEASAEVFPVAAALMAMVSGAAAGGLYYYLKKIKKL